MSLSKINWSELEHAYGAANDIPDLLAKLSDYPPNRKYNAEPYFSLWSALCHQGDTCTAAYAAVPFILGLAEVEPCRVTFDYLLLPTAIEVARLTGRGPDIPLPLKDEYTAAIQGMPRIVGLIPGRDSDETLCLTCCAAIAASAGRPTLAEAILELEGDTAAEFLKGRFAQ